MQYYDDIIYLHIPHQNVKSKIAYATDTWTTKQMVYTFACTVASFIDDEWDLIECVIDFKPLEDKEHEGYLGGMVFINGACQRGGLDKMSVIYLSLKLFHLPCHCPLCQPYN